MNLRANVIIHVTTRMETVWSCDCIMFKKTFYAVVDRLQLVSYHLVFYYTSVLKEFKSDLPDFLIG